MRTKNWCQTLRALSILLIAAGCSKSGEVKCGEGTVLKDGTCVVEGAQPKEKPAEIDAAPKAAPPGITCAEACEKTASCKGLNAAAPLVKGQCESFCQEVAEAPEQARIDYLRCAEKADCTKMTDCIGEFSKATAPELREAKDDDPIRITKVKVRRGDYGIGKELSIRYRSNAEKVIDGVKFHYFCFNNFDDPVGNGRLISQDKMKPGKSDRGTWRLYGDDTCTKAKVIVTNVHYVDGETWEAD